MTTRMRWLIASAVVCGLAGAAHADRAEQLFKKGKKLLGEKKYSEACNAFVQSDQLDPQIGAKLNVARCYEEWGKLATALRWYGEAEQLASKANDDRADKIHSLIAELDSHVPHLTMSLPADAVTDGVVVRLDGVVVPVSALGDDRRVDPGPHRIDTIVDGATRSKVVPIERGERVDVPLPVPVRKAARVAVKKREVPPDPGDTRRFVGLGIAGVGALAVGISGIATLRARGDYQRALDGYCSGKTNMCDETGLSRTHRARDHANIATMVAVGGLAAVAGGLVVFFTAPRAEDRRTVYLAPTVGADGAGVVLGGGF